MKKIVASVGLAALGAASAQGQAVPGQTPAMPKPWSDSLTLRGFYDDNLNTATSGSPEKTGVFGFEVSPSVGYQWAPTPQTHLSAAYVSSIKY